MNIPIEDRVYINEVHFRLRENIERFGSWDYVVARDRGDGTYERLGILDASLRYEEYRSTL